MGERGMRKETQEENQHNELIIYKGLTKLGSSRQERSGPYAPQSGDDCLGNPPASHPSLSYTPMNTALFLHDV